MKKFKPDIYQTDPNHVNVYVDKTHSYQYRLCAVNQNPPAYKNKGCSLVIGHKGVMA